MSSEILLRGYKDHLRIAWTGELLAFCRFRVDRGQAVSGQAVSYSSVKINAQPAGRIGNGKRASVRATLAFSALISASEGVRLFHPIRF